MTTNEGRKSVDRALEIVELIDSEADAQDVMGAQFISLIVVELCHRLDKRVSDITHERVLKSAQEAIDAIDRLNDE